MTDESPKSFTVTFDRVHNEAECRQLAATLAGLAMVCGARGVIVAVSVDREGHSDYGLAGRGPCLEQEGLGCRIKHFLSNLWRHAETPPSVTSAVTASTFRDGSGGSGGK